MYLHIGENVSIPEKDIIGIFDIDKTTTTGETRSFLSNSETTFQSQYKKSLLTGSFFPVRYYRKKY